MSYNLYGTDITAAKVVERFPGRNPNPVLRMTPGGQLLYANEASRPITAALGIDVGDRSARRAARQRARRWRTRRGSPSRSPARAAGPSACTPVASPSSSSSTCTARTSPPRRPSTSSRTRTPTRSLRLTRAGRMTLRQSRKRARPEGARAREVGDQTRARAPSSGSSPRRRRTRPDASRSRRTGTIYRLRVVSVYEFDSINLYGTDITAARQVEALSRERAAAAEHPAGLDRRAAARRRDGHRRPLRATWPCCSPTSSASPTLSAQISRRRRWSRLLNDVFSTLRRARRPVRAREDQDDRRRLHGRRRAATGRPSDGPRRRVADDGARHGPRDRSTSSTRRRPRGRARDPRRHARRAGRRRRHRHQEVHLRRLGRHGEHRQPHGVDRRARAGSRSHPRRASACATASSSSPAGSSTSRARAHRDVVSHRSTFRVTVELGLHCSSTRPSRFAAGNWCRDVGSG